MKIQEYQFSKDSRKDTALVDFINDATKLLNSGRYQMRVVSSVPTHVGDEGEFLLYISGTVRRLYFYDSINFTWHFLNWNSAGFSHATIVTSSQLTEQTDDIATTTIYTPSSAGLFRINVYMICTTAGTGTLSCTIGWTDLAGAKAISPTGTVDLSSIANGATGISFISTGASAITLATAIAGKAGSPKYAFYIVLEALV